MFNNEGGIIERSLCYFTELIYNEPLATLATVCLLLTHDVVLHKN